MIILFWIVERLFVKIWVCIYDYDCVMNGLVDVLCRCVVCVIMNKIKILYSDCRFIFK